MNRALEQKKQRREYLKQRGYGYGKMAVAGIFMIPCILVAALLGLGALIALLISTGGGSADAFSSGMLALFVAGVFVVLTVMLWKTAQEGRTEANIPYVPPVTADILPVEEVLVRGAEAPAATSATLLRPTTATQETKTEELLRVTQE